MSSTDSAAAPLASTSALTLDSPPMLLASAQASSTSSKPGAAFFREARVSVHSFEVPLTTDWLN